MFRFYLSRVYKTRTFLSNGESTTTLGLIQTPFLIRSFCASNAINESAVSYLINSCGLSEKTAISMSKKIQFISSPQPGTVLTMSGDNEFPNSDIFKIMEKRRSMLLSNADKTIKPKIEFLKSLGLSGADLDKLLTKSPTILFRSVEKELMPSVTFLKSILPTETDVIHMIKYSPWLFAHDPRKRLEPSIAILQSHGVPICNILKFLKWSPNILIRITTKRLSVITEEAKGLQFDPAKFAFLRAVQGLACMSRSSREAKSAIYKSWGWSDDDVRMAFRKQPQCMMISEKKISGCMEFLVNKLGYDALLFAKQPMLLMYSLEKRTIPRLSVIRVLISNNLLKKDFNISTVMHGSDEFFFKEFVTKYEEQLPKLLDVYKGKTECSSNCSGKKFIKRRRSTLIKMKF